MSETPMTSAQDIVEETIKLTASDGHTFEAFHAAPKGASKGGLVILQEIFGITDQLKSVAVGYARDGYDAIIPAVFDRVKPGTVFGFDQAEPGREMAYGLALDKVMLDCAAAIARVQSSRGVSVLGFCWGGGVIIRAAAELDLRGQSHSTARGCRLTSTKSRNARCCSTSPRPIRTRRRRSSSRCARRFPRPTAISTTPAMPSPTTRGRPTTKPPPRPRVVGEGMAGVVD